MSAGGRVILHVGAPKTGSTYLQTRLRANASALRARGVYVPVLPAVAAMAGNAKLLATVLGGEPTASFRRAFPGMDTSRLSPPQVVDDLMRGWDPDREDIILSAENFRPGQAAHLRALLPQTVDVVVVMFVRRQDLWIDSYYQQLVKTRDITCKPDEFVRILCRTAGERLCRPDWLAHHLAWSAEFEHVRTLCYDALKETLFESFLDATGLTRATDVADIPRTRVAMDTLQLAYLTELPPDMPFDAFLERRAACEEVVRREALHCRTSLLGAAALAEISARFRTSNAGLLERLGQPGLEPLLQPRTEGGSEAPLRDLLASPAFERFRTQVDALVAARVGEPASLGA